MIKKEYELGIETQDGARVVVVRPFVFAQNFIITFFLFREKAARR